MTMEIACVVVMMCGTIKYICDPATANVLAAWKGVELSETIDLHNIIFEEDALDIVQLSSSERGRLLGTIW
jgi:hypothetical protein